MSIDLETIRKWIASEGERHGSLDCPWEHSSAVDHLRNAVAEIERLREKIAELEACSVTETEQLGDGCEQCGSTGHFQCDRPNPWFRKPTPVSTNDDTNVEGSCPHFTKEYKPNVCIHCLLAREEEHLLD